MIKWLKNLFWPSVPEIPYEKPAPSPPPKWNGGFAPRPAPHITFKSDYQPPQIKPEEDWAELSADEVAKQITDKIKGENNGSGNQK